MVPKASATMAWRPNSMQNGAIRATNSGGLFGTSQLAAHLNLVWRTRVYVREKTVGAAKPLWFLKAPLTLAADKYQRII